MRWSPIILILLISQLVNCDPLDKTENENRLKTCGKNIQTKVFKGRTAAQSEAPWSVFFISIGKNNMSDVCTASIVSPRHMLIATHCIANLNGEKWTIDGNFDQANCKNGDYVITDKEKMKKILFQSDKVTIARAPEKITLVNACLQRKPDELVEKFNKKGINYNPRPREYVDDFAIIDLYEELTFSKTAQMVCVAEDKSANAVNTKLDYYGFGLNPPKEKDASKADDNTGTLRQETVHVFDRLMVDYYFLARDKSGKNVACEGDSGGGAIGNINNRKTIIGVLSQTSCEKNDSRTDGKAMEQYASVGYYSDKICEMTGICKSDGDYDKHHKGYVKQEKPVRKLEDIQPPVNAGPAQDGDGAAGQTVHAREPDSAIGKNFILILSFVIFVLIF